MFVSLWLFRSVALAVLVAGTSAAMAGEVWTLGGRTHAGEVTVSGSADAAGVVVKTAGGESVQVPLPEVLHATFRPPEPPAIQNPLPMPFRGSDIGEVAAGRGSYLGRTFSLAGAGLGLSGQKDSAFFAWHTLHGFSDLRARLVDVRGAPGKTGAAGITIRTSMSSTAAHVTLLVDSAGKARLVSRSEHGGDTSTTDAGALALPCYLRINRDGSKFTAETSPTGAEWRAAGTVELKEDRSNEPVGRGLRYTAFAGMIVTSGSGEDKGVASFDHVLSREPKAHPNKPRYGSDTLAPAQWTSAPPELTGKGVLLKSGTYLADADVGSLENGEVSFKVAGEAGKEPRLLKVKSDAVAQVVFAPLGADTLGSIPASRGGLLLMSGDFVEGRFRGVQEGQVRISSVIFGIQKFDLATHALAVVMAPPAPDPAAMRVTLRNGSVIMARRISADGSAVVLDEPTLGAWSVPRADLYRIAAPASRATPLTFVRPDKTELPEGFNPVGVSVFDPTLGAWTQLQGATGDAAIALAAPSEIMFNLEGKPAGKLVLRVGVPARSSAKAAVTFIVRDESRELWRSAALRPEDAAQAVNIPLRGGKRLVLRVESTGEGAAFGVLGDATLVRGE